MVGMATGYAIGRRRAGARPAAHDRRARKRGQRTRHRPGEPRAAGRARRPAGPPAPLLRAVPRREARRARRRLPGGFEQPVRAQDVPGAIERAYHAAATWRGPALVIVPMDDWDEPADEEREPAAATGTVHRGGRRRPRSGRRARRLPGRRGVARARGRRRRGRRGVVGGAGRARRAPASPRSSRRRSVPAPAFRRTTRCTWACSRPTGPRLRERLAPYDAILVVGAPRVPSVRLRARAASTEPGTRLAVVTTTRKSCTAAPRSCRVLGATCCGVPRARRSAPRARRPTRPSRWRPRAACAAGRRRAADRQPRARRARRATAARRGRARGGARRPARLATGCSPREPLGYLSAAQGGLGFALPGATGLRMALPNRPIVAVVGDGSAIYQIQAVWSAVHYSVGAALRRPIERWLRSHGRARRDGTGGPGPGPASATSSSPRSRAASAARRRRIATHDELTATLDEVVPTLGGRTEPLLLDVVIEPTRAFNY